MQRMAEMGMPMNMGAGTSTSMPRAMDHSGHTMPPDTMRR
jgi:hypothetical protein